MKRDHYLQVAEAILVEAGVQHIVYLDRQIRAYASRELRGKKRRYIVLSRPTTAKRLLTLAHEAAHVYFRHGKSLSSHRSEYEAEHYAFAALRRYTINFDEKTALTVPKLMLLQKYAWVAAL